MSIDMLRSRLQFAEENPHIFDQVDVLDKGFVRLVDWCGDDARIVEAARTSYQTGTKMVRSDAGLLGYLMRHKHTSPFEQVSFTFHIKMPLFVFGHIVRHRTGKLNAQSYRYSEAKDEFYIPAKARSQDSVNTQGSNADDRLNSHQMRSIIDEVGRISYRGYDTLRRVGVARELSRIILPQNIYTEIYWTQDLHNLLHLLRLRADKHAQWETQEYARAMLSIIEPIVPITIDAWKKYQVNSVTLSSTEMELVGQVLTPEQVEEITQIVNESDKLSRGEKSEVLEKIQRFLTKE